jgi:hypothetical protein
MKVTRSENFTPITIVLETEAEAREMWARLDASSNMINKYASPSGPKSDDFIGRGMFIKFDCCFNVSEKR